MLEGGLRASRDNHYELKLGGRRCRWGEMGEGRGLTSTSVVDLLSAGIHFVSRANSGSDERSKVQSRLWIGIVMDREDFAIVYCSVEKSEKAFADVEEGERNDYAEQGGGIRVPGSEFMETLMAKLS